MVRRNSRTKQSQARCNYQRIQRDTNLRETNFKICNFYWKLFSKKGTVPLQHEMKTNFLLFRSALIARIDRSLDVSSNRNARVIPFFSLYELQSVSYFFLSSQTLLISSPRSFLPSFLPSFLLSLSSQSSYPFSHFVRVCRIIVVTEIPGVGRHPSSFLRAPPPMGSPFRPLRRPLPSILISGRRISY